MTTLTVKVAYMHTTTARRIVKLPLSLLLYCFEKRVWGFRQEQRTFTEVSVVHLTHDRSNNHHAICVSQNSRRSAGKARRMRGNSFRSAGKVERSRFLLFRSRRTKTCYSVYYPA